MKIQKQYHVHQSGFSLLELMITVAIIGILMAIALPMYGHFVERARLTDAQTELVKVNESIVQAKLRGNLNGDTVNQLANNNALRAEVSAHYNISASCGDQSACAGNDTVLVYYLYATPVSGSTYQKALWMTHTGTTYQCDTETSAKARQKTGACAIK